MSHDPVLEPIGAAETPASWTFKDKGIADNFNAHVRAQLPWYETLSSFVADLALTFIPRDGVVYDVGASTGHMTKLIDSRGGSHKKATYVSLDPSREMASVFDGKGELLTMDAERMHFASRRPDVTILFLCLMFIDKATREDVMKRIAAATKPGGAIIVVDKGFLQETEIQIACQKALMASKRDAGQTGDAYVTKELSLRGEQRPTDVFALLSLFRNSGFITEEFFRFGDFYGLCAIKSGL